MALAGARHLGRNMAGTKYRPQLLRAPAMQHTLLVLAGIGNSGPDHWQSRWQAELPAVDKVILIAHSLACLLVVASLRRRRSPASALER